jgi:Ca2+-binding RTX toxin-like protein
MVTTAIINGQNGSNWLATLPDGVTLSQQGVTNGPYFLEPGRPVLNINYEYDLAAVFDPALTHGITSIQFSDLDGGGQNDDSGNGLRGSIAINFINELGVPLGTATGTPFFIYLADAQSDAENNPVHPLYAHFHGVQTTYGGLTATPGTFSGSGTPGAPSTIDLTGVIAADTTASIGIATLHERDQANSDDSFSLNFFPTAETISPTDFANLQAQWDALTNPPVAPPAATSFLSGTPGDDTLPGTDDPDVIFGGLGNDTITGAGGNDLLRGGRGDDDINTGAGDDVVLAGPGDDTVGGMAGSDTVEAGAGNDLVAWNDPTGDLVFGGRGHDTLRGGDVAADTIHGGSGDDLIRAVANQELATHAADLLFGDKGDDAVLGGNANDTIEGGEGDDVLSGFGGADTFVFRFDAPGNDTINDFDTTADVVQLIGFDAGFDPLANLSETSSGTVLDLGEAGEVLFFGRLANEFSAGSFIL